MTISTVHGRVMSRPGDEDFAKIGHESAVTATGLNFFFKGYRGVWKEYEIHFYDYEKPSGNVQTIAIAISTNGASFETVAAYDHTKMFYSATSALVASGATGDASGNFSSGTTFSLATATGRRAAWGRVRIRNNEANVDTPFDVEWHYLNSASQQAVAKMSGMFASGPLGGVQIGIAAGTTFSMEADVYGIGRIN